MKAKRDLLAFVLDQGRHIIARKWVKSLSDAMSWAADLMDGKGYEIAVYELKSDVPVFHCALETLWTWQNKEACL